MKKLVEVKNLFSYYGGICALNGISLFINEGEITSIVGSNGAGKSTLMRTIAGDKRIDSGEIMVINALIPERLFLKINHYQKMFMRWFPAVSHLFPKDGTYFPHYLYVKI
ncbi:MAG: transporter ATP-binding protein [Clostridiales bacterium]|nr:transporter ATP-binding protein [Clostridiales bacterium]